MECRSHQSMFWENMDQDGPWVEAPASSYGLGVQRPGLEQTRPFREGAERLECLPTPLGGRSYQDCSVVFLNLSVKYAPKVQTVLVLWPMSLMSSYPFLGRLTPKIIAGTCGFSHHLFSFSIPQNTIIIYQNMGVIDLRLH